ncbi:unnamed protein product [Symbiodinium sp. CCMP2592]|nr:unnamed protein product [Symbiodinium sp. CCMP2592]CAE7499449.1 unnamed protein product [Symbiodinium sp. CCMP2592]
MLVLGGAARVRGPCYEELAQTSWLQLVLLQPVEECLRTSLPCGVMSALSALSAFSAPQLILCGHSFGAAVGRSVAAHLAACGLAVGGLVAMDDRAVELLSWAEPSQSPSVPRGLLGSLSPNKHRLDLGHVSLALAYVAPAVPRANLAARFLRNERLAAWWSLTFQCRPLHLADTDHFTLAASHAWDLTSR